MVLITSAICEDRGQTVQYPRPHCRIITATTSTKATKQMKPIQPTMIAVRSSCPEGDHYEWLHHLRSGYDLPTRVIGWAKRHINVYDTVASLRAESDTHIAHIADPATLIYQVVHPTRWVNKV